MAVSTIKKSSVRFDPSAVISSKSVVYATQGTLRSNDDASNDYDQMSSKVSKPSVKVKLERILGITVLGNVGLASSSTTGIIAYIAGCTIVLYNPKKNQQSHIINVSSKAFTSLSFSEDGRFLVTGECGHNPCVRIWDVIERQMVSEFHSHKFGINCVSFAPFNKFVVSVGAHHDMVVNVWEWRTGVKIASNKISTKIRAISFAENGTYFVTAGNRHVKYWYLYQERTQFKEAVPLMGRSAILGEQRNNYFYDVECGRGEMADSTYAITKSGLLCEFNNRRLLDKWVELRTAGAYSLSVGNDFIFIGCANGIVRCFSPVTLQFITTLPRTHYLGMDFSKGLNINHMGINPVDAKYPDAYAVTFDQQNQKVTVVYNDYSIYIWDVRDIKKVGKSHSFLFHSACIWDLDLYPDKTGSTSDLPVDSFITCSSDDTIRIWNLSPTLPTNSFYRRNIYSNELLVALYIDPELLFLRLNSIKKCDASSNENRAGQSEDISNKHDQRNGVRCIRISPDGKHLASGDRSGNIRIHNLQMGHEICKIEAHDAEVLCVEYWSTRDESRYQPSQKFLASASRDRLIHVFDAADDYRFINTQDDHSSSITSIKFVSNKNRHQMVSCGADKTIVFRDIDFKAETFNQLFTRTNHILGKTTLYDMDIDNDCNNIVTACQDRNIRVYSINESGKHIKTFKGSLSDDGTLIKVTLDRSGTYLATSCTDKSIALFDYATGECLASMIGHSELVTGIKFSHDSKYLISVSGDGCIFVWTLPAEMTALMISRAVPSVSEEHNYRFSMGPLPVWAKKHIAPLDVSKRVKDTEFVATTQMEGTTEDSSLGSFTAIEGDIDEFSETATTTQDEDGGSTDREGRRNMNVTYFGHQDGHASEYTVNAMDVDELRRSQRRFKRSMNNEISLKDDEEDTELEEDLIESFELQSGRADTPSAIATLSTTSSENVNLVGRRESFLKSNFDSLSGMEDVKQEFATPNSISNKFRESSEFSSAVQRNAITIARAQSFRGYEQNKKRLDMQQKIEETRRKLQNISYRSTTIKGSRSISDLSLIPYMEASGDISNSTKLTSNRRSTVNRQVFNNRPNSTEPSDYRALRRACSLSDLTKPTVASRKSAVNVKNLNTNKPRSVVGISRQSVPPDLKVKPSKEILYRHLTKASQLNDASSVENLKPSYMRSTSASTKKERALQGGLVTNATLARRRSFLGHSQSSFDLRQRVREDDSSSEDISLKSLPRNISDQKKSNPSQDRNLSSTLPRNSKRSSDYYPSKVTKVKLGSGNETRSKMRTTTLIGCDDGNDFMANQRSMQYSETTESADVESFSKVSPQFNQPCISDNTSSIQLSLKLTQDVISTAETDVDKLLQLYKRASQDCDLDIESRTAIIRKLSICAGNIRSTLEPIDQTVAALVDDSNDNGMLLASNLPVKRDLAKAAMASINQIMSKQGFLSSPPPRTTAISTSTSQDQIHNNPYFQHMIENYSNMVYDHSQHSPSGSHPIFSSRGGSSEHVLPATSLNQQGPRWC